MCPEEGLEELCSVEHMDDAMCHTQPLQPAAPLTRTKGADDYLLRCTRLHHGGMRALDRMAAVRAHPAPEACSHALCDEAYRTPTLAHDQPAPEGARLGPACCGCGTSWPVLKPQVTSKLIRKNQNSVRP